VRWTVLRIGKFGSALDTPRRARTDDCDVTRVVRTQAFVFGTSKTEQFGLTQLTIVRTVPGFVEPKAVVQRALLNFWQNQCPPTVHPSPSLIGDISRR